MQIVLTLKTYLVSDLQNPLSRFQFVYRQGPTGIEPKVKFVEKE